MDYHLVKSFSEFIRELHEYYPSLRHLDSTAVANLIGDGLLTLQPDDAKVADDVEELGGVMLEIGFWSDSSNNPEIS